MVTISLSALLAVCGAIVSVSAAAGVIAKVYQAIKKPEKVQNQQISELTENLTKVEDKMETDRERLDDLETGMQYVLEALFALLSHAIDGNDVDGMKTVKAKLNTYLIGKVKQND